MQRWLGCMKRGKASDISFPPCLLGAAQFLDAGLQCDVDQLV